MHFFFMTNTSELDPGENFIVYVIIETKFLVAVTSV